MADLLNLGSVYATLEMRMNKWQKSQLMAKKDMQGLRGFALKNEQAIQKMSRGFAVAGAAIGAAMGLAIKKSIEFNREIANIATLMPEATHEILELKRNIQDLGVRYGKNTTDLARGAYQVVSAFGAQAAQSKKLEITTAAATAGMSTTTDAINLLSAVTKGYGVVTDEAYQRAADLAFETVRMGQTTFPELAASIGRTVPLAAKMGVKAEELFATFATLTGVTGNAAEVSTQMAAILRAMIKPTEGAKQAIKDLEFQTAEQMITQLGMVGALKAMIGTTDGTTTAIGKLFGRAEALTAVFALTGGQTDAFTEKLAGMDAAAGANVRALKAVTEGVNKTGFTFEQTKQRIAVMIQTIGDSLLPAFNAILTAVKPILSIFQFLASIFTALPTPIKALIGGLVALTATTLLVMAAGSKLLLVWSKIPATITTTAAAMGPWIAAIAAAVIAIGVLRKAFNALGKSYDRQMAKIAEAARKEQDIFGRLMQFKKNATEADKKLYAESVAFRNRLDVESREQALKTQVLYLKNHSENFKKFWNAEMKAKKVRTTAEIQEELKLQKEIERITIAARQKATAGTIAEFEFRRQEASRIYREEQERLKELNADKAAFVASAQAYNAELKRINSDRMEFIKSRQAEHIGEIEAMNQAHIEKEILRRQLYDEFIKEQDELARLSVLEGRERERAENEIWYKEQLERLRLSLLNKKIGIAEYQKFRLAIEKQYVENVNSLQEKQHKSWIARLQEKYKIEIQAFNDIMSAFQKYLNSRMKALDIWYANEKKVIETSTMNQEEKAVAMEALDAEYDAKRTALMRKQAIADKATNIASAIMNTATAVTAALKAGPIIGPILAGIIGALGAAQIAVIAKTPLPLERGAFIKEEGIALLHPNEVVMPAAQIPNIINNTFEGAGGGMRLNITIQALDGADVETVFYEKIIPMIERSARDEQLRIPQGAVVENV